MGWKAIKEHYKIEHIVQVDDRKGICIGSPYVHDIMVIGFDGTIIKGYPDDGWNSNQDLMRYQKEMLENPDLLKTLVHQPDTFEKSLPVYTYDYKTGEIIEKECEELGWPNVTHDGHVMYENTFSDDLKTVVEWAKSNTQARIENLKERILEHELTLVKMRESLQEAEQGLENLESKYSFKNEY